MWMLWPFDDGPGVSLHGAEQFDRGLLPHGVRPQGNHEVRHLGDFIQVIRPLKHHFLDLERGKWWQVDVCDTVYMSGHAGSQRWVTEKSRLISGGVKRRHREMSLNSPAVQRKHQHFKMDRLCFLHMTNIWCGTRRWVPSSGFSFISSTSQNITVVTSGHRNIYTWTSTWPQTSALWWCWRERFSLTSDQSEHFGRFFGSLGFFWKWVGFFWHLTGLEIRR